MKIIDKWQLLNIILTPLLSMSIEEEKNSERRSNKVEKGGKWTWRKVRRALENILHLSDGNALPLRGKILGSGISICCSLSL